MIACLMILTACSTTSKVVCTPWDIPERPEIIGVTWHRTDNSYCLTPEHAKSLLININRLKTHIIILESQIESMNEAYCGK